MNPQKKRLLILVGAILLIAIASGIYLYVNRPQGPDVIVTVNGQTYGSYPLDKDQTIRIEDKEKTWHNTLKIENSKAYILDSDCDNQICVHMPPLVKDVFGIIVCLPHGVAVELSE